MLYTDTIAAIATPSGTGGVGIVRISGPDSRAIADSVFVPRRTGPWKTHQMRYGHVVDGSGTVLDEVLAVLMRGPHSFTGEDVVEVSCHGGPLVLRTLLDLVLERGARQAEAGEFTMRAFLNGRIDLTQAEATLDVITARTPQGLALAQAQLGGWLATRVRHIRTRVIDALAYVTALLDFPEDEIGEYDPLPPVVQARAATEQLLASAEQGVIYREGARVALIGVPNVGKSSLLNALLRTDRAIVTDIPGTTRDTLEETANLHGVPVVLIDTAGITATSDRVEQIGIARSRAALSRADLALLVLDSSRPITPAEADIIGLIGQRPCIVVLNKADVVADAQPPNLPFVPAATVHMSALTGAGLETLTLAIASVLGVHALAEPALVTNPRHRDALLRALHHIRDAETSIRAAHTPDVLAVDLSAALTVLGEITGEDASDDLLNAIFSRFCIGK